MYLENISDPEDLKKLSFEQLTLLAEEVRHRMIEVVSSTGGHLASSLGAVELTIALHYCLDMPKDKIVWDVGHQCYAHKILTGRNKDFASLRQYKGISGFPAKDESPFDTFITGHSSTAISLALGLACARDQLDKEKYYRVAAVIGDGSLSGGLCFEGLNNTGHLKKDILIILNTNELSIAPNVGALSTYLNKLISLPVYNRFKSSLESFAKERLPKGSRLVKIANKFEEGLKGLFVPGMLFEELGFRYFGPLDGHDLYTLIPTLKNIRDIKGPLLVHVVTKKGKGYSPAENDPVRFHGTGPFDIPTGKPSKSAGDSSYTTVFSKKLVKLAEKDLSINAITAAMPEGTGLDRFRDLYPGRFFDVGIAEGHAVCFAAGLARQGLKPVVAIYSTFLQRAYDQIIECASLQKLGIIFAVDRAGIVGEDGVTHQGLFDISYLRNIPEMVLMAPADASELESMLEFAVKLGGPSAIRYPRAAAPKRVYCDKPIHIGRSEILKEGGDFALVALGTMVEPSFEAVEILAKEGFKGTLVNARFVRPMDIELFKEIASKIKLIFSAEEGIVEGGFGSALSEGIGRPVVKIGLPAEFIVHGSRGILLDKYGLTAKGIADKIRREARR
ncbi:MAG: 1-deoxy-D-xylulose-5-phosphate synthase [Candidatus Omnitrophota bacterium]|jgi:1-deoxy-D-xylulose-5-phosphate synthase